MVHTQELQGRQSGESMATLSPNSGSQDRTASPKSSWHNVMQHKESYKCTSVEECGGVSYWKWNIKQAPEGLGQKHWTVTSRPLLAKRETLFQNLLNLSLSLILLSSLPSSLSPSISLSFFS